MVHGDETVRDVAPKRLIRATLIRERRRGIESETAASRFSNRVRRLNA